MVENRGYTIAPTLKRKSAQVFTGQSQKCVKNVNPVTIERGDPL